MRRSVITPRVRSEGLRPTANCKQQTSNWPSDQFDDRHLGVVTPPGTNPHDAGVAAGAFRVPRSDIVEELRNDLGALDHLQHRAARMQIALAGLGDQLLR